MPALPKVPLSRRTTPLDDPEVALAVAVILSGRSKLNGKDSGVKAYVHFARVVREYFSEHPEARLAFLRWYRTWTP